MKCVCVVMLSEACKLELKSRFVLGLILVLKSEVP